MTLLRGLAVPSHGLGMVCRRTMEVGGSKIELGQGIAAIGSFAIPAHRFDIVFRDAQAVRIDRPEIVFGSNRTLIGRLAIPMHGLGVILGRSATPLIEDP